MDQQRRRYLNDSWCAFEFDPALSEWVEASVDAARNSVNEAEHQIWLRHQGTWFAGVNALNNDCTGKVPRGIALQGKAFDFVRQQLGFTSVKLDRAQVSVCYPGYPQPSTDEPESAFGFRLRRDAAHIDGILRQGDARRRFVSEFHGFILGIPMVSYSPGAAPFVVWRGSHEVARKMFALLLDDLPVDRWSKVDITECYQALRKSIFEQCERVEIALQPGEAFIVHRLALHGTAPWQPGADAGADGRMICYFRPADLTPGEWLRLP